MAKLYNEDKHCDLDLFYSKKTAFFDNIDFSQASPEEINKIMNLAISEIFFDDCIFTNLNLSNKKFFRKITFNKCLFKGNTNFSNSQFEDFISFDRSTFDGITKFNDTVFNAGVSFVEIHTKPARGGYFYYAEMVLITVNTPNIMKMFWIFQERSLKPKFHFSVAAFLKTPHLVVPHFITNSGFQNAISA